MQTIVDPIGFVSAARTTPEDDDWGSTICKVVERQGRTLVVAELDAIDGTPVLDIKPVMAEFLPREATRQPAWATGLMAAYWRNSQEDER